jgi:hypothetical protein
MSPVIVWGELYIAIVEFRDSVVQLQDIGIADDLRRQ